jgi:hypothetical protein
MKKNILYVGNEADYYDGFGIEEDNDGDALL